MGTYSRSDLLVANSVVRDQEVAPTSLLEK